MKRLQGLVLVAGLVSGASAWACRFVPDLRPMEARWAEVALLYVGTVVEVHDDGSSVMVVEHLLKGSAPGRVVIPAPATSCDSRLGKGQRWLFTNSASMVAPNALLGADGVGVLTRHKDAHLGLPAAWQACVADAECVLVPHGCDVTAASKRHAREAETRAWKVGGDPRAVSCENARTPTLSPRPLCEAQVCGAWSIP